MALKTAWRVIIVGSGPAGLAAAIALRQRGIDDLLLLEKAATPGGWARHMAGGSRWLRHRLARLEGLPLWTTATVTQLAPGPRLTVETGHTVTHLTARRVLLATGSDWQLPAGLPLETLPLERALTRALPPSPRAVLHSDGELLWPSLGWLWRRGYRVGSLLESRHHPLALSRGFRWGLRLGGIRCQRQRTDDGALLFDTAGYRPQLPSRHHLPLQNGAVAVDQYGRSHDPWIFAAGDVLHPPRSVAVAAAEGRRVAHCLADSLDGQLPLPVREIPLFIEALSYPQRLAEPGPGAAVGAVRPRQVVGQLTLTADDWPLAQQARRLWPHYWHELPRAWLRVPLANGVHIVLR